MGMFSYRIQVFVACVAAKAFFMGPQRAGRRQLPELYRLYREKQKRGQDWAADHFSGAHTHALVRTTSGWHHEILVE